MVMMRSSPCWTHLWRAAASHKRVSGVVRRSRAGNHILGYLTPLSTSRSLRSRLLTTTTSLDHGNNDELDDEGLQAMTTETRKLADHVLGLARQNSTFESPSASNDDDDDAQTRRLYTQRRALSQAITLLESHAPHKQQQANALLLYLQRQSSSQTLEQNSLRIGIAGAPGAGKSSLIEALGTFLLNQNNTIRHAAPNTEASAEASSAEDVNVSEPIDYIPHKLAVVCIDPSSVVTGGSILGDKTRMTQLSANPRAYVRPAPSTSGTLGGLAGERTHDIVQLLTEYAGYDTALIETVGLGQSEVDIAQTVDVTVLLIPPGGGDALQGAKKGILEVVDIVCVTKADGELESTARTTAADYQGALQLIKATSPNTNNNNGISKVLLASSETGYGLPELWQAIVDVRQHRIESGEWQERRQKQSNFWMWKSFRNLVQQQVQDQLQLDDTEHLKHLPPRVAAWRLLKQVFPPDRSTR